ncbi:hypothetical protein A8139_16650 [Marinomonas primoryensis]|uniref:Uncharacterized protein n=1 Tax=Marinomonas primoryensis TaxID=178399 RepID=A0A2Z4PWI7_9GAMM|nr:hypothetical protein [Marinomonas primoryensis]AWY01404.1 hypothetical protein A8139_16650 [Marinomonas primoryensis]
MNNKLSSDLIFIISFWGGLAFGFLLYVLLMFNNDLVFCFDLSCYGRALDIFSLPLSVVAGGMGLAAFRATIFRSNQTRAQISESIVQNKFKNYIDHKKELMSLLDMLESAHGVTITNRPYLYKNLFPKNSPTCVMFDSKDLDCDRSWLDFQLDEFNELIIKYNEIGTKICVDDKSLSAQEVARWLSSYLLLICKLDINFPHSLIVSNQYIGLFSDSDKLNRIPPNIGNSFYVVSEYFEHLSSFALPSRAEAISIRGIASFDTRFDKWLEVFTRGNA